MRHLLKTLSLCILLTSLTACGGGSSGGGGDETPSTPTPPPVDSGEPNAPTPPDNPSNPPASDDFSAVLPVIHEYDAQKAKEGKALFEEHSLSNGIIPMLGIRHLWPTWCSTPTDAFSCYIEKGLTMYANDDAYWAEFRSRYGLLEAPFENDGLPLGMRKTESETVTFDCMMCHAGKVAGNVIIGAPNTTIDLQALLDDLALANKVAPTYGIPSFSVPFMVYNKTGAAGVTDAVGIGFEATKISGLNTDYGFQRPGAWWGVKYKNTLYSDGSGKVEGQGYRLMTATLIALGESYTDIQTRDTDFENILNYILSIDAPEWPSTIDTVAAKRGESVYENKCASCHGDNQGFPDKLVNNVGTDIQRATNFTSNETRLINASWFGNTPMTATNAYVAPPLTGVWARAPYFHNGSVPTLKAVLKSSDRPSYWVRTGSEASDYDFTNVGWKYSVGVAKTDRTTYAGRRTYDTTLSGMSKGGHTYGDNLTDAERDDLIEFLKTL